MIAAHVPVQRPDDARLLVVDGCGRIGHHWRSHLPTLLRPGDVLIANDAATLPASLDGIHVPTDQPIEVRLVAHAAGALALGRHFTALVFGEGDFRTPTERRAASPALAAGDVLRIGPLRAAIEKLLDHPRIITLNFEGSRSEIWEGLARHGRPIQYAHIPSPLAIWDVWTPIAALPVSFEPPSASFVLDWKTLQALRARGVRFATVTHAAGISSTGDFVLDSRLPFDECYRIPEVTARLIANAKSKPGRIIAVGTTVVRALEAAAAADGSIRPGEGIATQRIGRHTPLRVVDAILSGAHEQGTSHYELLGAFVNSSMLRRIARHLDRRGYRTHEFGDSVLIENANQHSASVSEDHFGSQAVPPRAGSALIDGAVGIVVAPLGKLMMAIRARITSLDVIGDRQGCGVSRSVRSARSVER